MNERQKRLIEVYDHLRRHFGIHTKTGFAEAVRYGRTSMSAALNGDENYLTDNLFKKICEAYPGTFNLDYLLNGHGDLLTPEEDAKSETIRMEHEQQPPFDIGALIDKAVDVAVSAKNETINTLKSQMADLRIQLVEKDKTIEDKEEKIAMMRQRIAELEAAQVLYAGKDPMKDFPFKHGVAERDEKESARV